MKKIWIMTASTGGGHNRAAKAIEEELIKNKFKGEEVQCEIIDSLKLIGTTFDKLISDGYEMTAKYAPNAYGKAYRLSEKEFWNKREFKNNLMIIAMARKYKALIKKEQPDLIIGTHAFPLIALSKLKKACRGDFIDEEYSEFYTDDGMYIPPLISVLTDYTAHSTYIQDEISYYIAGDEYVKELLISEGIEEDKILPFGIPVEKSFLKSRERDIVLKELSLDPNKKTILLMGGSFGAGNIKGSLENIITVDEDFQVLVITGRNESLKNKLELAVKNYDTDKNIQILGFTNKMNDILAACDILVTKPGGLTTTEAILKEIPMVIPYFIPGQEEDNLDFFTNSGAAMRTSKKVKINTVIKLLLDNPQRLENMKANIRLIKKEKSSENIAKLAFEIFEKENSIKKELLPRKIQTNSVALKSSKNSFMNIFSFSLLCFFTQLIVKN